MPEHRIMEGGGRKKRTGSSVAPWWSFVFGGYRFIIIALILQLLLVTYMLLSYSSSPSPSPRPSTPTNPYLLFIGIFSSRQSFEQRQAVRETWLKFPLPQKFSMKYKFIVGASDCVARDCDLEVLQQDFKISEEIDEYDDVLKLDILEGQLTSTSEMLWTTYSWLRDNLQIQYFLKIDHDSFLRLDLLAEEIFKQPARKAFWSGFVWKQEIPTYAGRNSSYQLEHLPPYASGQTFYLSSDVVEGLSEAKPSINLPDEGQSMALWLLPFKIIPEHDPRFQPGDTCATEMMAKCNLSPQNMRAIYMDTLAYQDPCVSFSRANCPLCFECEPSQPHWKLKGLKCDRTGAVKSKPGSVASMEDNPTKGVLGFLPLLQCSNRLVEDLDTTKNLVKDGRAPDSKHWKFSENVKHHKSEGAVSLSVRDSGPTASYITQEIPVGQTHAEAVVVSGWSRADGVGHTSVGDYCLLADFTFTDGTKAYAVTVDFAEGTHDWEYNVKIFDPPQPIKSITLRCMLRVTTGTVWFNNISVRNLKDALCDLKHQSNYFGVFRPEALPDLRTHLHNRPITSGGLPRESKQGIANGREGLVDFHIHTDDTENGETSAHHTIFSSGLRFVVIWASPVSTFKLRNRRVIESIFFHHPDAHVIVYSNVLPLYFFHEFNSAGYDVQVERYDLNVLAKGLPGASWVKDVHKWETGEFFYSHLSDFLSFVVLYRYGGVYTDMDSILLRPISMENVVVAEVCGSGGCSKDGDKTIKSKYYLPTGFMAFTANHALLLESLTLFDTDYDSSVRHCGSIFLSMAYTKQAEASPGTNISVSVLPVKSFYPIPEKEIVKYFTQDNPERWQSIITGETYAFHFWGTLTRDVAVAESSLMRRALTQFSISNQRDVTDLQF